MLHEPLEYAKKLFQNREYFGAFTVIHTLIEFWMQNLVELDYLKRHDPIKQLEFLKKTEEERGYRYSKLRNTLVKQGFITSEEAKRIENFGRLRDRIVHRLVKYTFQTYKWYIVRKDEVIQGFEEGLALVHLLSAKSTHRWSMTVGGTIKSQSKKAI